MKEIKKIKEELENCLLKSRENVENSKRSKDFRMSYIMCAKDYLDRAEILLDLLSSTSNQWWGNRSNSADQAQEWGTKLPWTNPRPPK